MNLPSGLSSLVDELAIASKKLANLEAEAAKIPTAQAKVQELRDKLVLILDSNGFDESAVDLLLAAR